MKSTFAYADAIRSLVTVIPRKGDQGRGFIVEGKAMRRYILTASHCLPHLPPCHPNSYTEERTYESLVAPFGAKAATIWAECLFVDPVADIAVLGEPDGQALIDPWKAYDEFVNKGAPLAVRAARKKENGWLLALDDETWFRVQVSSDYRIALHEAEEPMLAGMSGSADSGRRWLRHRDLLHGHKIGQRPHRMAQSEAFNEPAGMATGGV
jgi:hypothetical protein